MDQLYLYSDQDEGPCVKYLCSYFDDRWNKNRSVTDVNWSKKVNYNTDVYRALIFVTIDT